LLDAAVLRVLANPGNGIQEINMIGTSIGAFIVAVREESTAIVKKANGDPHKIIDLALDQLVTRELCSAEDRKHLGVCFSEALSVSSGEKKAQNALVACRKHAASLVADPKGSDVARALAELCTSTMTSELLKEPGTLASKAVSGTSIPGGSGASILLWGAIGAGIGGSIGGPLGGLIGAGVGAAVGACGGDTQVTVTTPT
jgi:hypothetical protein